MGQGRILGEASVEVISIILRYFEEGEKVTENEERNWLRVFVDGWWCEQ